MSKEPKESRSEPTSKGSAGTSRGRSTAKKRKKKAKSAAKKQPGPPSTEKTKPAAAAPAPESEPKGAVDIYQFADQLDAARTRPQEAAEAETPEQWVSFMLQHQTFALPVSDVQEILRVGGITRVPHAPAAVLGVSNRRGRVLPVVDLRVRLRVESTEPTDVSRIIVVSTDGRLIGLLVDRVHQVEPILRSKIQPPPEDVATPETQALLGVVHHHGEMIVLLDLARTLRFEPEAGSRIA